MLRLYVNFFQPSLKLLSKKRDGAKVTKKYDKAKTPYQRLMLSQHLTSIEKEKLATQYDKLDPVDLLNNLVKLQDNFWRHAWKPSGEDDIVECGAAENVINELIDLKISDIHGVVNGANNVEIQNTETQSTDNINTDLTNSTKLVNQQLITEETALLVNNIRRYRRTKNQEKTMPQGLG